VVAVVLIATTPALTPAALSVSDTVGDVANSTGDIAPTDTDGDGLLDSTEQAGETEGGHTLLGANHTRKDLYLTVYVGAGVEPLTDEEQADLREIWASMPVQNPNGTSGIDLHITQFELSDSVTTDLSQPSLDYLNDRVYERRVPVNAQCSVYAVALGEVTTETELDGRAFSPGYFAVVDGSETNTYDTQYTIRTVTITHEVLHNIVGEFDDRTTHTSEGWLSAGHETHGTQFYMADKTARKLSTEGFADSEFFEMEVC
jgi:hypothetical protein